MCKRPSITDKAHDLSYWNRSKTMTFTSLHDWRKKVFFFLLFDWVSVSTKSFRRSRQWSVVWVSKKNIHWCLQFNAVFFFRFLLVCWLSGRRMNESKIRALSTSGEKMLRQYYFIVILSGEANAKRESKLASSLCAYVLTLDHWNSTTNWIIFFSEQNLLLLLHGHQVRRR
jgi:hypothetical protein